MISSKSARVRVFTLIFLIPQLWGSDPFVVYKCEYWVFKVLCKMCLLQILYGIITYMTLKKKKRGSSSSLPNQVLPSFRTISVFTECPYIICPWHMKSNITHLHFKKGLLKLTCILYHWDVFHLSNLNLPTPTFWL